MFHYSILNTPSFPINISRVDEIFADIDIMIDSLQKGMINIAFISDEEMKELNQKYRGKDVTTDVLSFHYYDDVEILSDDGVTGEILMSEPRIQLQASEHHHSETEEFETLLIHALLHILGFDHESDDDYEMMWEYERPIREKFKLSLWE